MAGAEEGDVRAGEAAHREATDRHVVHPVADGLDGAVLGDEVGQPHAPPGDADPRLRLAAGEARAQVVRRVGRRDEHGTIATQADVVVRIVSCSA